MNICEAVRGSIFPADHIAPRFPESCVEEQKFRTTCLPAEARIALMALRRLVLPCQGTKPGR
jgi:hypothetical protein